MRYRATVSFNTALNQRFLAAYTASIEATTEPLRGWAHRPTIYAGRTEFDGVFPTRPEAVAVILGTIPARCRLAIMTDRHGPPVIRLLPLNARAGRTLGENGLDGMKIAKPRQRKAETDDGGARSEAVWQARMAGDLEA